MKTPFSYPTITIADPKAARQSLPSIMMPEGYQVRGERPDLLKIVEIVFECDSIDALGIYMRLRDNALRQAAQMHKAAVA